MFVYGQKTTGHFSCTVCFTGSLVSNRMVMFCYFSFAVFVQQIYNDILFIHQLKQNVICIIVNCILLQNSNAKQEVTNKPSSC